MKDIIKEIERLTERMRSLKAQDDSKPSETLKVLYWQSRSKREGMIEACRLLGIKVEIVDLEGLKWGVTGVAE